MSSHFSARLLQTGKITTCLVLIAPLTQAGLNPARDFAPRMVAYLCGWGSAVMPDQSGGAFWVYILAPIAGALAAGFFYTCVLEKMMDCGKKRTAADQ